ncbi:MAG: branched-chain amino acid ABC transporter permease [Kiloniellales bacterium]
MIQRSLRLIGGPADIGRTPLFWVGFAVAVAFFLLYPTQVSSFRASNVAYYLLNVPMGLGMALLWGYCGVLSFGHVAYFGIAAYLYGIIAGNMAGSSWGPLVGVGGGLLGCAIVAAIFGYFVFYARVQKWIIPILTLVFTLLLETFLGQTAGYQWRVGTVLLGGYNGMTGIPWFQLGGFVFEGYSFYYLCLGIVILTYFGLRMLMNAKFGQVVVAMREDELRTEMLGFDTRFRQCAVFVISAMLAGLSGLLYVQWGNYITPSQVGLLQAALPVVWTAVGGRTSLLAVVIATIVLNWLTYTLSSQGNQYAMVIIGGLLVVTMMFFPRGIVVMLAETIGRRPWRRRQAAEGRS